MDYDTFRTAWRNALQDSGLPTLGLDAMETLDLRSLDRTHKVFVEPLGGQDAPPFHVTATLFWNWHALHTARTNSDHDVLTEMLGRRTGEPLEVERPWIRLDIKLSARAPHDKPLLLPSKEAWATWERETSQRLEAIEPLIPDEEARFNRAGLVEVLAWREPLRATMVCGSGGDLRLEAVEISAGQILELPRAADGGEEDDGPEEELTAFFARVRAALCAWMQAVDALRPRVRER